MSGIATAAIIGSLISAGGSIYGAIAAGSQANRIRDNELDAANKELDDMKKKYQNLDTSNPYLNMENVMEDLTINQKQADFEKQTFQQSQANIMQSLQGAAGGSGIGALAQSLAQQGQLASQKSAASIGAQESANIRAERQMAGQIQAMERQGEQYSQQMEMQKQGQLLGIAQNQQQMYAQQEMALRSQSNQAIQQGLQQTGEMVAGWDASKMTKKQIQAMFPDQLS